MRLNASGGSRTAAHINEVTIQLLQAQEGEIPAACTFYYCVGSADILHWRGNPRHRSLCPPAVQYQSPGSIQLKG